MQSRMPSIVAVYGARARADLAGSAIGVAGLFGNPLDLGTAISYETGGTFNPAIRGGAGNRHVGLIQFGIPEQAHYGVTQQTPAAQQVDAAGRFLVDRGFKLGMGLADLYSAINAGHVGLYNRSDAGNGGAPGTVLDKVNDQMGGHKAKAAALLGGTSTPTPSPAARGGTKPQAGTDLAQALPGATLPTLAAPIPVSVASAFTPSPPDQQALISQRRG